MSQKTNKTLIAIILGALATIAAFLFEKNIKAKKSAPVKTTKKGKK